ncbi:MAG: hypothetical protein Tsb0021_09550 [Chlamydiales bacterium]
MLTIPIPRRKRKCIACEHQFNPGMEYASVLKETENDHVFSRDDFCLNCWKEQSVEAAKSYWKAKVPQTKRNPQDPESHLEEVLDLLREEMTKRNDYSDKVAFVLSLYLTRKKYIILRQEMELAGSEYYLYEVVSTEEMLNIKKCSLNLQEMQEIQEGLTKKIVHCHES